MGIGGEWENGREERSVSEGERVLSFELKPGTFRKRLLQKSFKFSPIPLWQWH
jgi:hypothetical protein